MNVSSVLTRVMELMPRNAPVRGALGAVKTTVELIRNRGYWSFYHAKGTVTLVDAYSTGTVAISLAGTAITGTSTVWTSAMTGRKIRIGTDPVDYTFTYASGTTGTISPAFVSATVTAATYTIYQDEYSLASDVGNVIEMYDITNQRLIRAVNPMIGIRYINWVNATYQYVNAAFQFGRDSNGYYKVTFLGPPDTAGLIRYLYYRVPTAVTGPNSTTDMPTIMDETVIQGTLWRVMMNAKVEGWQDQKMLFNEMLEARYRDDKAFLGSIHVLPREDELTGYNPNYTPAWLSVSLVSA